MIQNPYVPPTAIVDIDLATTTNSRPLLVWVASFLLCASLVIGIINTALRWNSMDAALKMRMSAFTPYLFGLLLLFFALDILFTYKLWCGRNWARIVILIFALIKILPLLPKMPSMLEHMTIHEYLDFAQIIAEFLGAYIAFATSARYWFARSRVTTF